MHISKLDRRDVDRNVELVRPTSRLLASAIRGAIRVRSRNVERPAARDGEVLGRPLTTIAILGEMNVEHSMAAFRLRPPI